MGSELVRRRFSMTATLALVLALSACTVGGDGGRPEAVPADGTAPSGDVVLRSDGLGVVDLGEPLSAVVDALTPLFGGPDRDSGWVSSVSAVYGTCPGTQLRAIGWGSLFTLFTSEDDGDDEAAWFTWTYGFDHDTALGGVDPRGLELSTEEGVGLGTSRSELRDRYGARLEEQGDATIDIWSFAVDAEAAASLRGTLSGPEPDAVVTFIERVPGCRDVEE